MNKKDTILWLALIALTLSAYFSSGFELEKSTLVFILLTITAVKFFGVGFQFMELKKAHSFWKVTFVLLFAIYGVLVLVLA